MALKKKCSEVIIVRIQPLKIFTIFGLALISFCFLLPSSAHAYLDPGTGSYMFQMLIAGLIGASFAVKVYWKKIVSFFSNSSSEEKESRPDNE